MQSIKLKQLENNTGQIPGVMQNPRDLDNAGFEKTKKSIENFPKMLEVRQLVVVKHDKKYVVIGGNQRLRALRALGHTKAPCVIVDWPTELMNEFIIKDNLSYGEWNYQLLDTEWDNELLIDWGLDIPINDNPIEESESGLIDEDEIPEISENPITKLGDIWLLGEHRLMCGDSISIDDVEKLMNGRKADLLLTDPPYNVAYEGKTKDKLTIKNDKMNDGNFKQFLTDVYKNADLVMNPGAVFYIWHADSEGYNFRAAASEILWKIRPCLIWNKNSLVMGRQDYHWKHEPCLYGWKEGAAHYWGNDRSQTTVIDFDRPSRSEFHPTMKPVGLMEYQIKNSSKPKTIVLDLFGGSGTTLIACQKNNRISYNMELDQKYCDVIIKRWQEFTGKHAVLESTQQTFEGLSNEKS